MNDITTYIKDSRRQGKTDEEIANRLRTAGWRDEAIDKAFVDVSQHKEIHHFDVDTSDNARLNFLYLLSFITLYISVFAFIGTSFGSIDAVFGVPLDMENLRWNIAFLVVLFPVFLITNHFIRKTAAKDAGQLHMSSTGRAFTYITLFVTALALIISAVRLVYELTGGELVTTSVLKILIIVFVAGSLFGYYFNDVRKVGPKKEQ